MPRGASVQDRSAHVIPGCLPTSPVPQGGRTCAVQSDTLMERLAHGIVPHRPPSTVLSAMIDLPDHRPGHPVLADRDRTWRVPTVKGAWTLMERALTGSLLRHPRGTTSAPTDPYGCPAWRYPVSFTEDADLAQHPIINFRHLESDCCIHV